MTTLPGAGGGRPNRNQRGGEDARWRRKCFERDGRSIGEIVVRNIYVAWNGSGGLRSGYALMQDHIDVLNNDVARNLAFVGRLSARTPPADLITRDLRLR